MSNNNKHYFLLLTIEHRGKKSTTYFILKQNVFNQKYLVYILISDFLQFINRHIYTNLPLLVPYVDFLFHMKEREDKKTVCVYVCVWKESRKGAIGNCHATCNFA